MADQEQQTDKYWIKPGIKVRYKDDGRELEVMRILQTREKYANGEIYHRIQGVKCSWKDDHGNEYSDIFHSRHLSPIQSELGQG
jgi:hypothetical protein